MTKAKQEDGLIIIELSNYVRPEIVETKSKEWVLNGKNHSFYKDLISAYNGSPTLKAITDSYVRLIFGKGVKNERVKDLIDKEDLRRIVTDGESLGSAIIQVLYEGSGKARKMTRLAHFPREQVAPERMNEDGEILGYYYSQDWTKANQNPPQRIPAFGTSKEPIEFFELKTYSAGRLYFTDPDFISALSYAFLEEEIQNFAVRHVQSGLSAGYFINVNSGKPATVERAQEMERKIKGKLTSSSQAGSIVIQFNNNKDEATTIEPMPVNERQHLQWTFWAEEARRQLMVANGVTSPMLFGIKDNTGLGNNADELMTATKLLHEMKVKPKQEVYLDGLMRILKDAGIDGELEFSQLDMFVDVLPTGDTVTETKPTDEQLLKAQLSEEILSDTAQWLIEQGEDEVNSDEWELVDVSQVVNDQSAFEIKLARVFSSFPNSKSEQDNTLFKVRYKYKPEHISPNTREFCTKLVNAAKTYRKEDIILAGDKVVNSGFGPRGADTYSIWLYKGGVRCKHFWERSIFLRRNNEKITVNEARRMINALEPSDRAGVRLPENEKEVAQIAESRNNFWKLN